LVGITLHAAQKRYAGEQVFNCLDLRYFYAIRL